MYTQCPECESAFRVTADVLRKAAGMVRCGSCSHAFNSLDFLSEERPERSQPPSDIPELRPEPADEQPALARKSISAEHSAALLKTLDQLAGEDIRIEDTGVEWRVLDSDLDDGAEPLDDSEFVDDPEITNAYNLDDEDGGIADSGSAGDAEASGLWIFDESGGDETQRDEERDSSDTGDAHAGTVVEETSLFEDRETDIDEVLDGNPTPVDELLDAGPAEVQHADVFEPAAQEMRFDDNTPLPDDYLDDDPTPTVAPAETPAEEAPALESSEGTDADWQASLTLGDPDEWQQLLSDFDNLLTNDLNPADELNGSTASAADTRSSDPAPAMHEETNVETVAALYVESDGNDGSSSGTQETAAATNDEDLEHALDSASRLAESLNESPDESGDESRGESRGESHEETPQELLTETADESAGDVGEEALDRVRTQGDAEPEFGAHDPGTHEPGADETGNDREAASEAAARADDEDSEPDAESDAVRFREQDADAAEDADDWITGTAEPSADEANEHLPVNDDGLDLSRILDPDEESLRDEADALEVEADDEDLPELTDLGTDTGDEAQPEHEVPPQTEEEQTINRLIDQDLLAIAHQDEDGFASTIIFEALDENIAVETVVIGDAEDDADNAKSEATDEEHDTGDERLSLAVAEDAAPADEEESSRRRLLMVAGVAALALVLGVQAIHQQRESLATNPALHSVLAPVYSAIGKPLMPNWDVSGWDIARTQGATDDEDRLLTIVSEIRNTAGAALPYPIVTLSLTDRFQDPIGALVMEPADYLADAASAGTLVEPGATFEAVIPIGEPSPDAVGYTINACYRTPNRDLRCAVDDFK